MFGIDKNTLAYFNLGVMAMKFFETMPIDYLSRDPQGQADWNYI